MMNAYFAGGCFWCITPTFKEMIGVKDVISGYSGGNESDPKYEDVKKQKTGHRETICIEYDENQVSFSELLQVFINSVDPFDEGGQFIDRGFSYTLAVYFQNENEKQATEAAVGILQRESGKTAYIGIERFKSFYPAEEYHQDYYLKNPEEFEKELVTSGRKK